MINKLKKRIYLILSASLAITITAIIIGVVFFNYTNTINATTNVIEKFSDGARRKEDVQPIEKKAEKGSDSEQEIKQKEEFNSEQEMKQKEDSDMEEPLKPLEDIEIEGFYNIKIENFQVLENTEFDIDEEIKEYALKVSKKNRNSGIIGNYIYKVRKDMNNSIEVLLFENKTAVEHVKNVCIFSIFLEIFLLMAIHFISKKISSIIVKPVKDTFDKQKQFISDASHELKTPLAIIEANADVLENEAGKSKWLKYIQNEIESMNKLINELLLLAKIENVDEIRNYDKFNLSKEIEIYVSVFESMAYEKNVTLKTNIKENIEFNGCKEDIEHIISTLTDNAIKHTKEGKEVVVELFKDKNNIIIQVKNIGDEIPESERKNIFERFYRIDKSRNRNEKRYGLGLAIAKSTVEKYKGKIEVLYKDSYNIFKVELPQNG
ncbi:MAG: HAMP domain-containing histidine kinase [Clostridia bacterium]|nr:HAMP domain-containing histidine kinase [Clostridia bacterium]